MMVPCLFLALLLLTCSAVAVPGHCEPVSVPLCQNLPYNRTLMPNRLGHATQSESAAMLHQLQPLLVSNCSRHVRLLVCSQLLPFCWPALAVGLPCCRPLCRRVRRDCRPMLTAAGLGWPPALDCSWLPPAGALCMQMDLPHLQPAPPAPAGTLDCANCSRPAVKGTSDVRDESDHSTASILPAVRLRAFMLWCLVAAASVCFILNVCSLITCCGSPNRLCYPHRPVIYITVCGSLYSLSIVIFIIPELIGYPALGCSLGSMSNTNMATARCVLSYLLVEYFEMACRMWWLILLVAWLVCSWLKWSCESVGEYGVLMQLVGWCTPLVWLCAIVLCGAASADGFSGLCAVRRGSGPALVLLVLRSAALVASSTITLVTLVSLTRCRRRLQRQGYQVSGLTGQICSMALHSALFLTFSASHLVAEVVLTVEPHFLLWTSQCALQRHPADYDSYLILSIFHSLRWCMSLCISLAGSSWFWSSGHSHLTAQ